MACRTTRKEPNRQQQAKLIAQIKYKMSEPRRQIRDGHKRSTKRTAAVDLTRHEPTQTAKSKRNPSNCWLFKPAASRDDYFLTVCVCFCCRCSGG
jgi:hypothetical protein